MWTTTSASSVTAHTVGVEITDLVQHGVDRLKPGYHVVVRFKVLVYLTS